MLCSGRTDHLTKRGNFYKRETIPYQYAYSLVVLNTRYGKKFHEVRPKHSFRGELIVFKDKRNQYLCLVLVNALRVDV